MLTKIEAQKALDILQNHFGVKCTLKWHGRTKRAFARPLFRYIHLGPRCRGMFSLLHEYAHILEYDRVKQTPKKHEPHHGEEFRKSLWEVVTFWHGDPSKYRWDWEYQGVKKYGEKRILRESSTSKEMKDNLSTNTKGEDMFTVDSGFVMPEVTRRRGKSEKYAFSKLSVTVPGQAGDSFFVPVPEDSDIDTLVKTVRHAAYSAEKRLSKGETKVRFSVFPDTEHNGVRVFRSE